MKYGHEHIAQSISQMKCSNGFLCRRSAVVLRAMRSQYTITYESCTQIYLYQKESTMKMVSNLGTSLALHL